MDKTVGNFRRVISRHTSPPSSSSGPNNSVVCGLTREKVKRMSEGTMSSDVESELSRRKFKLPKKGLCDSIPVLPATVPRKLRSAISKRSCKSASASVLDSKKLKHSYNGVASLRKYGTGNSPRQADSIPISKEEEEVAETLFALAGMISHNGESSEGNTQSMTRNNLNGPMSVTEDSTVRDSVQESPLIEASSLSWPKLSERRQLHQDLKVSVPPMRIPPLLRTCDERQLKDTSMISQVSIAPIRVDDSKIDKVSYPLWQSQHFANNQGREPDTLLEKQDPLHRFGLDGLPSKSSSILYPSWVNATASSSRPGTLGDSVSLPANKIPSSVNGITKSRKRCITHVYISHLIQGMVKTVGKDNQPLPSYQVQPSQSSFIAPDRNDLSGAFTSHMLCSTFYKNTCETGNRVSMNLEHRENKGDGTMKQRFDFLSLLTGVAPKADTGTNRFGNGLESQSQVPNLHSVSQTSVSQTCSTIQNCFPSRVYRDQVAVASMARHPVPPQVQMPQYFANAFNPAHMIRTGTTKSTQHRQPNPEQQQQQIWTSQLGPQFRPGPLLSSHAADWQNQRQDPRILTQLIQPHLPPSQPSVERIGTKYVDNSRYRSPQTGTLPPVLQEKGGRFLPDGVLPFQLLCNERL
ncbi:hypothetical protein KSS87_007705 [Heliosperma pusillum]|nr:hypothetical protein KSS87_007705 [Heliosperma pusillum]